MDQSDVVRSMAADSITLQVMYFARLREVLGCASESVALPAETPTVAALRDHLRSRGGAWAAELAPSRAVRIAVNQAMADPHTALKAGDEVAFFPPVTGG